MELDIGNHPGRMVNLRYCLGDEILKLKRLATTHINRDEKIAFRFDPLPNKLCFLADCMFPVKPICIEVLDAGQQDYLVMIFSIVVVGAAGFGMLSALGHFMMRVSKKPKRRQKYLLRQERMSRKEKLADIKAKLEHEETLIISTATNGRHAATLLAH